MEFPKELWIYIKNYLFDYKKFWKSKMNLSLKYNKDKNSISYRKATVFLYREQIRNFNIVKEYWISKNNFDEKMNREQVYRWIDN